MTLFAHLLNSLWIEGTSRDSRVESESCEIVRESFFSGSECRCRNGYCHEDFLGSISNAWLSAPRFSTIFSGVFEDRRLGSNQVVINIILTSSSTLRTSVI